MSPLFQGETYCFCTFCPSVCHKILRALLLLNRLSDRFETWYSASLPFVDVHIVRTGGSNYFPSSYGGSNRGGGCKKHLRLTGMNIPTYLTQTYSGQDRGSNNFPSSYGGSNKGGGCKIACEHFSFYMVYQITLKFGFIPCSTLTRGILQYCSYQFWILHPFIPSIAQNTVIVSMFLLKLPPPYQATILMGGSSTLEQFQFGEEGETFVFNKNKLYL